MPSCRIPFIGQSRWAGWENLSQGAIASLNTFCMLCKKVNDMGWWFYLHQKLMGLRSGCIPRIRMFSRRSPKKKTNFLKVC